MSSIALDRSQVLSSMETQGTWMPLQLSQEARATFMERAMFPPPRDKDVAASEDEERPSPIVCCHLKLLDNLTIVAQPEEWGVNNWLLLMHVYLREVFCRQLQLNQIMAFYPTGLTDPTSLCFHTGLLTHSLVPIHCLIVPSAFQGSVMPSWMRNAPWMVAAFYEESHLYDSGKWTEIKRKASLLSQTLNASPFEMRNLPKKPRFFSDDTAVMASVYDERIPIIESMISVEEILGLQASDDEEIRRRKIRSPHKYRDLSPQHFLGAIKLGLASTLARLSVNPRSAVPIFIRTKIDAGMVYLVVPSNLSGDADPDCGLVLERRRTPDRGLEYYHIVRILDIKWSRAYARTIQRIDQPWLELPSSKPPPAALASVWSEPPPPPRSARPLVERSYSAPRAHPYEMPPRRREAYDPGLPPADAPRRPLSERLVDHAPFNVHVPVPLAAVPLVIGKQGAVIRRIADETGTNIVSPRKEQEQPIFSIGGNSEAAVYDARTRILQIVEQSTREGATAASAPPTGGRPPAHDHPPYGGGGGGGGYGAGSANGPPPAAYGAPGPAASGHYGGAPASAGGYGQGGYPPAEPQSYYGAPAASAPAATAAAAPASNGYGPYAPQGPASAYAGSQASAAGTAATHQQQYQQYTQALAAYNATYGTNYAPTQPPPASAQAPPPPAPHGGSGGAPYAYGGYSGGAY